jgi:hypothetical protein
MKMAENLKSLDNLEEDWGGLPSGKPPPLLD